MDEIYIAAMQEHLAQLAEELEELSALLEVSERLPQLIYRGAERNLQLLTEACIGIAKQTLKSRALAVPSDARQSFIKLRALGLDPTDADWNRIIGLRNALVHDYLNFDPAVVLQIIKARKYQVLLDFAFGILRSC
ncbi:type VII toxin-antitoxin system HepT family RNase toxin [Marinospirillum alkaliphilum]|uniref:Uncharacterized conserved protein YutE, UPF0331/DUF86 family n=1 Tax=Marinospirillum alkaliphilum DSM 21637 TaxID=1122209 RepID=A0A1K1U8T2_9GAMM|nr:DUF86 domain-containing protein [Marinospirillum alkaliphilum]SFX09216.1 Uncharacterized conserved protein YutE, UPF0331/DUF86 family [Marinospirillum alkaliphilum DSM 21637]